MSEQTISEDESQAEEQSPAEELIPKKPSRLCPRGIQTFTVARQAGLEKAGVFSPENLAFKMLRRSEALSKLHDVYIKAYDRALSLDQWLK